MTNYKEILRLHSLGINNTRIAESCGCARSTVIAALQRAAEQGFSWNKIKNCSTEEVARKQQVDVRLTRTTVEIFFAGTRIASHLRLHGRPNQYSTVEDHMPPDHQAYLQWNGDRFVRWAEQIGRHTAAVVRLFLSAHKVEQQGYKSCMALLKLSDRYSTQRLESACRKVLSYTTSPSLKSVQTILKSGQDRLPPVEPPAQEEAPKAHKFTRGAGYYKRGE